MRYVLMGESGVGKTTLLRSLAAGTFEPATRRTIGVEMSVSGHIEWWDMAGARRYSPVDMVYEHAARSSALVLLLFADADSFVALQRRWHAYAVHAPRLMLVALRAPPCGRDRVHEAYARSIGASYIVADATHSLAALRRALAATNHVAKQQQR
jgi:energy-coupling factor transporter ATP-binding protein EcfA2